MFLEGPNPGLARTENFSLYLEFQRTFHRPYLWMYLGHAQSMLEDWQLGLSKPLSNTITTYISDGP